MPHKHIIHLVILLLLNDRNVIILMVQYLNLDLSVVGSMIGPSAVVGSRGGCPDAGDFMIILINDRLKYKYLLIEMDGIRTHRITIHFIMNLIEYL